MASIHFETSRPVDGPFFVDREEELHRLDVALDKLTEGTSSFLAILGLRKQGKTSLFYEWMRQNQKRHGIVFVPVQCWAWSNPEDFFREYLRLTINAALSTSGMHDIVGLLGHHENRGLLVELTSKAVRNNLDEFTKALRLKADYDILPDRSAVFREVVRMPEYLATRLKLRFQFILDEFQELSRFDTFKTVKTGFGSVYAMLREEWQLQKTCNYIVSGSAMTMLRQILQEPSAPFFQHFTILTIGPLSEANAVSKLLKEFSTMSGYPIPDDLCRTIVRTVGGNPYYLQVLGEEMMLNAYRSGKPDERHWKKTCQRVLLEPSGRLYQYFELMHNKIVGSSSMLEKIILTLAEGPKRGVEIAHALGITQNRISSKLPILERQDIIEKEGLTYMLSDPCYALWLRSAHTPLPNVMAPLLLGNESEKNVAREMARQGLSLIYHSKASRGAFDLLALYQAHQIGIQVKRIRKFPVYISSQELGRMQHDAALLGWRALLAFNSGENVTFHALTSGKLTKKGKRFDEQGALRHVLDIVAES